MSCPPTEEQNIPALFAVRCAKPTTSRSLAGSIFISPSISALSLQTYLGLHAANMVSTGSTSPWAREGSGFTLLFEQDLLILYREMPVAKVAEVTGVTDHRTTSPYSWIWRGKLDLLFLPLLTRGARRLLPSKRISRHMAVRKKITEVVCDMSPAFFCRQQEIAF